MRDEAMKAMYKAFNDRDIDTVLAVMHADVDWPNGVEGLSLIHIFLTLYVNPPM